MNITRMSAYAAIAAPLIQVACDFIAGLQQRGYSLSADAISYLLLGPYAAIVRIAFYCSSALVIIFALGFQKRLPKNRFLTTATGIFLCIGLALVMIGTFDPSRGAPLTLANIIHTVSASFVFVLFPISFFLLLPSLRADPHWRKIFLYTLFAGIMGLGLEVIRQNPLVQSGDFGLFERLMTWNIGLWLEVVGFYSLKLDFDRKRNQSSIAGRQIQPIIPESIGFPESLAGRDDRGPSGPHLFFPDRRSAHPPKNPSSPEQ